MTVGILGSETAWLDTGRHGTLIKAGEFVRTIEERQALTIDCPDEVGFRMGYIGHKQLVALAVSLEKSGYGSYLRRIAESSGSTA